MRDDGTMARGSMAEAAEPGDLAMTEPRSPTLLDLVGLVAGSAAALTLPRGLRWGGTLVPLGGFLGFLLAGIMLAVTGAVLCRLARYRRPARPGEWLATLVGLASFGVFPSLGLAAVFLGVLPARTPQDVAQWVDAGMAATAAAALFGALFLARRRVPWVVRHIGMAAVMLALFWGPIRLLVRELVGFIPAWSQPTPEWSLWGSFQLHQQVERLPRHLVFLVPLAAVYRDRGRINAREWIWTERVGVAGVGFFALAVFAPNWTALPDLARHLDTKNVAQVAGPIFGLAVSWWLSLGIVRRFGPA